MSMVGHVPVQWSADFMTHHGNEMTTRELGGIHEVACPFELRRAAWWLRMERVRCLCTTILRHSGLRS
jgi:hypothetical protein